MNITNIMEYLDSTAEKVPDKIAFSDTKTGLTFTQLRKTSRKIASRLLKDGFCKEPIVVFMEKSPQAVAANFATVYAGNYYVTIDREMPKHRIEMIFENLKPRAVICEESTVDLSEQMCDSKIFLFSEISESEVDENALAKIRARSIDLDPVYIVFTSGSTGIPKGITASHRSVIDYIENLSDVLQANDTTVFGNQAPLYVDACLKEVYTTIRSGATAYLIPREMFMFPVKLVEFLNRYKINTICWVSSALSMIATLNTFGSIVPEHLKTIAFGSEVLPVKNLNIWRAALPDARFINLYGPTEATGMSCYYEVNRAFSDDDKIPIGKPFRNTEILLLDDNNQVISAEKSVGEIGEICIRGSCLSLGYYNDFAKTNEFFIQNPTTENYPDLIYRTGDLGSYNQAGELEFHARKDHQIKHMGYRIELPEIEIALCRKKEVSLACCLHDKEKGKLLLFYTGSLTVSEVTKALKENLPRYMVPNRVFALSEMPLTPNGKIDRVSLYQKYMEKD
ncbi:MAG: amino acid adenylation domain-containing protein [Oscillospiraceae bacterium]|nr:amino acid adenylation domain-containing protein [Oscillospiraceae bacterium]